MRTSASLALFVVGSVLTLTSQHSLEQSAARFLAGDLEIYQSAGQMHNQELFDV